MDPFPSLLRTRTGSGPTAPLNYDIPTAIHRELLAGLIPLALAVLLVLSMASTLEQLYFTAAWVAVGVAAGLMLGATDGKRIIDGLATQGQAPREADARSLAIVLVTLLPLLAVFLLVMYARSDAAVPTLWWAAVGAAVFVLVASGIRAGSRAWALREFQGTSGRRVRISRLGRASVYRTE